jgi:hypothetical protein
MRAILAALVTILALPCAAATLAVNLSGTTGPDFGNQLNDTDVEVARYVLQPTGGAVSIDAITVHVSNFVLADEAFTGVRLFFDADGNGTFDPSEEVATSQVPSGAASDLTFTETFSAPSGLIRTLQLRVNIGNNTTAYGESYNFSIDPQADITLTNPGTDTISSATVAVSNDITIRHSENQLVPGTGNPTGPRETGFGKQNLGALHFIVSSLTPPGPGQLQGIDLNSITVSVTCATSAQTAVVTRLRLWQDDGDANFEPGNGEVLIQERTSADVGKWVVAGSVISVTYDGLPVQNLSDVPSGATKSLWVSIDFGDGVDTTCEVSVTRTNILGALGAAADFFVTNPNFISGNVITVTTPPDPPKSAEPPGEGGCSTDDMPGSWVLVLVALALAKIVAGLLCKARPAGPT